jgi:hypothetical protein
MIIPLVQATKSKKAMRLRTDHRAPEHWVVEANMASGWKEKERFTSYYTVDRSKKLGGVSRTRTGFVLFQRACNEILFNLCRILFEHTDENIQRVPGNNPHVLTRDSTTDTIELDDAYLIFDTEFGNWTVLWKGKETESGRFYNKYAVLQKYIYSKLWTLGDDLPWRESLEYLDGMVEEYLDRIKCT